MPGQSRLDQTAAQEIDPRLARGYSPGVRHILVLLALIPLGCSGSQYKQDTTPQRSWTAQSADAPDKKKSLLEDFIDDEDRALDISDFLDRDLGFLPLVVPITEPAVGFGLVGGVVFFHDKGEQKPGVPPTLTAVLGGATTNDTWLGAIAHQHVWKDGAIRYLGAVGYANVNLDFFGIGAGTGDDRSADLNFEGFLLLQDVRFQIGESRFFVGADYVFTNIDTSIALPILPIPPIRVAQQSSGLGAYAAYDSRDNHFTPGKGIDAVLGGRWYGEAIGSDNEYLKLRGKFRMWIPVGSRVVLGLRFDAEATSDDAPLYDMSWIQMRGVPAFRYVDNIAMTLELEPRFQITDRWGAVVFGGVGQVADDISDLSTDDTVFAVGAGFRYLIARKRGIQAGIDVAYSDGDTAFYITVGSAWLR